MARDESNDSIFTDLLTKFRFKEFRAPGDIQSVFICSKHPDLSVPSKFDFADLIQAVEQYGQGTPATLAWLIKQSTHADDMLASLAQTAIDIDCILHRGLGIKFAAMCQEDYESLLVAPDRWLRTEEVLGEENQLPEAMIAEFMIRMIDAELSRLTPPKDVRFETILTNMRRKLRPYADEYKKEEAEVRRSVIDPKGKNHDDDET